MAEDFTAYRSQEAVNRRKLYRYGREEQERLAALDFEEIVAVIASESTSSW
jgi:hypothetical protein